MHSDATPTRPATPGFPPSPARSSNLKSRWRRGPAAGPPKPAAGRPASVGAVADLASARESLSGPLARGPAEPPAPLAPEVIERAPLPAPAAAPFAEAAPEPPPAKASPAPVPPPASRPTPPRPPAAAVPSPAESGDGHRHFVSLRPDPANDPAPRRQRTDAPFSLPAPAPQTRDEYSPSRAPRRPHASIPIKAGRSGGAAAKPVSASRAHATIPADVEEARGAADAAPPVPTAPAAAGAGILGKIKRFFGFGGDSAPLLAPHHGESQYEKRQAARAHGPTPAGARGHEGDAAGAPRRRRRRGGRRHRAHRESGSSGAPQA